MPRSKSFVIALLTVLTSGCNSCASAPVTTAPDPLVSPADDPALGPLSWLSGTWRSEPGAEPRTVEHWLPPDGGTMLGVNRTVTDGRTVFFEYLRIEARGDDLVYLASPLGRDPPTEFRASDRGPTWIAFENPAHDYPQRIEYRREGDRLSMTISGQEDGTPESSTWTMQRVDPD